MEINKGAIIKKLFKTVEKERKGGCKLKYRY